MKALWILLLLPIPLLAQDFPFQQEFDIIPVEINDWQPFQPWDSGMSYSRPAFGDFDQDGDKDLIVGDFQKKLSVYRNQGVPTQAIFQYYTQPILPLDSIMAWSSPEFCDLNGDGDEDILFADNSCVVRYFENQSSGGQISFSLAGDSLTGTLPISWITTVDIDADGDQDLFAGAYLGTIYYFENIGTATQYQFILRTENFANIDVGYFSSPTFCDLDADGDYDLFIGEQYGHIWYYRNDGTPQQYDFTLVSSNWLGIDVGDFSAPEFCDIDGDGDYDLFVGREPFLGNPTHGDVFFYENIGTAQNPDFLFVTANYLTADVGNNNIEQFLDIDADGDLDLIVGCGPHLQFYRNTGDSQNPAFSLEDTIFANIELSDIQPYFCDLDSDGDYDLIAGTSAIPGPPEMRYYQNQGTAQNPHFILYSENFVPGNYWVIITPTLADIDADGDLDLFITDHDGHYFYYENVGTPQSPSFQFITDNWQGLSGESEIHRFLRFYDIDQDGDLDLFFFNNWNEPGGSNLRFYRNQGTAQNPQMILVTPTYLPFEVITACPWFCDIDFDSLTDLFVSDGNGGIVFFHGVDTTGVALPGTAPARPCKTTLSIGTNPANPITAISYKLQVASLVNLSVYDILGRLVTPLVSGKLSAGEHTVSWNASGNASGVYLIQLLTPQEAVVRKLILLK